MHRAVLAGAAGLFVLNAVAQPAAQPAMPAELRTTMPDAQRAGATRFTVWGFDVYDATLWTGPGFRAGQWAQRPFALELRYLRDFDGGDIAQRSLDEMRRVAPMTAAQSRQWLAEMKAAFPDVKKGDRLVGIYEPGNGARFFRNAGPTGAVRDAEFAQRFFSIWLGPQTSEPGMREALLAPAAR